MNNGHCGWTCNHLTSNVVYDLSISAIFNDLERHLTHMSRSRLYSIDASASASNASEVKTYGGIEICYYLFIIINGTKYTHI